MVTRIYVRTGDSLPFYGKGDKIVMDDDFPIPAGWTREDQILSINQIPQHQVAMGVGGSGMLQSAVKTAGSPKKQPSRRLSSLGEKVKSEYESLYAKQGCTCDPSEPYKCEHCRHPGNPRNIDFFEEYWEAAPAKSRADEIWEAITQAAGKGNT